MNFESFAESPPNLHCWDGTWCTGGFETYHLRAIYDFCRQNLVSHPNIIETGAGNSTICFLHLQPSRLVSIAPEKDLFERVDFYCCANGISTEPIQRYIDGSEWVLPELGKAARSVEPDFDLALIDGIHNWPTSMIDFFYINFMLKNGSFLMIDDIQLHSVAELVRFISYDTVNFRLRADFGKLQIFQKITDQRQLGEWITHPYIRRMSGRRLARLTNYFAKVIIKARDIHDKLPDWARR
jgi:hypothetical protein